MNPFDDGNKYTLEDLMKSIRDERSLGVEHTKSALIFCRLYFPKICRQANMRGSLPKEDLEDIYTGVYLAVVKGLARYNPDASANPYTYLNKDVWNVICAYYKKGYAYNDNEVRKGGKNGEKEYRNSQIMSLDAEISSDSKHGTYMDMLSDQMDVEGVVESHNRERTSDALQKMGIRADFVEEKVSHSARTGEASVVTRFVNIDMDNEKDRQNAIDATFATLFMGGVSAIDDHEEFEEFMNSMEY